MVTTQSECVILQRVRNWVDLDISEADKVWLKKEQSGLRSTRSARLKQGWNGVLERCSGTIPRAGSCCPLNHTRLVGAEVALTGHAWALGSRS